MDKRTPNFSQKGFSGNFLQLMNWVEQNKLCCLDFLTKIYTTNTADIILSGAGTEADPLKATLVAPGGGGIGTVNQAINGLHLDPLDTVKLGGDLTEATNITQTATANFLNINGFAGGSPFRIAGGAIPLTITGATGTGASITSSGVGAAIVGGTTGLTVVAPTLGVNITAGGATAAVSNTSALIATQTAPFVPVSLFVKQDLAGSVSGQAIPLDGLILRRDNGASVAIPIGAGISMKMQMQTAGQIRESFRVSAVANTLGGLNTDIQFWNLRSSSLQHTTMLSTGQMQFNQYTTVGAFPGTAIASLGIDATGKVLTLAPVAAPLFTSVNNGIEINTNVLQLGGALIKPTIISSAAAANSLTFNGELSAVEGFININGTDSSLSGLAPLIINRNSIVTAAPTDTLILREEVAAFNGGEGPAIKFQLKDSASTLDVGRIIVSETTGGAGFSNMQFLVADTNALAASFTLLDTGQIQFNRYTGTAFAGAPARSIGLDASGNIVTAAPIVIPTIPIQSANNGLTLNGTTVQLGGTLIQATSITTGAFGLTFNRTGGGGVIINGTTNSLNPALTIGGENSTVLINGNMNTGSNSSALYVGPTINTTTNGIVVFDVFPTITATGTNPLLIRSTNGTAAISFKHYVDGKVTIGDDTSGTNSAKLAVYSTTQGFLPPAMTTAQKNAIASPATGLMVFDTSTSKLNYRNNLSQWVELPGAQPVSNSTTTPVAITTVQSGTLFGNAGATANVQFNLPAATVGLVYEFAQIAVVATSAVIIKANGTDTITNGPNVSTAGGTATGTVKGDSAKLVCFVAGAWEIIGDEGNDWAIA